MKLFTVSLLVEYREQPEDRTRIAYAVVAPTAEVARELAEHAIPEGWQVTAVAPTIKEEGNPYLLSLGGD